MGTKCFMLEPTGDVHEEKDADGNAHVSWPLYRRADTGEVVSFRDAPPGAMIDLVKTDHHDFYSRMARPDGKYLMVKLPNGHSWIIDSQCSNCTRKGEPHDCWCRHGTPPNLTVDKTPEPGRSTCSAGAGSIQGGDWHGFLRNGELVQ